MQMIGTLAIQHQTMSGTIINKVSEVAGRRKMQIRDLEKASGVSYDTAKRFWKGTAQQIDFETLAAFCDALNCTVGDLFEFIPDDANGKNGDR